MCTNQALNRLECYMDELVDCIEDFVKKSLIMISVGVGMILLLLGYLFKLLTDRSSPGSLREVDRGRSRPESYCSLASRYVKGIASDSQLIKCKRQTSSTRVLADKKTVETPVQMSAVPSMEETFLKEVGYSNCSKACSANKRNLVRNGSTSRIIVPSLPPCAPKRNVQPRTCSKMVNARMSCCSCCAEENNR